MSSSTRTAGSTADRPDTRDMVVVHSGFRRELRLMPGLVDGVAAGDTRRSEIVGAHLELWMRLLHDHHTREDDYLWPLLHDRAPAELEPVVDLMESQHHVVEGLLDVIGPLAADWRTSAGAAERDALVPLLQRLHDALVEHMDAEESRLLPIAEQVLTGPEWRELGKGGDADIPKDVRLAVFGMFMADADPDGLAMMVGHLPLPVRVVIRLGLPRRAYRTYARRVHLTEVA
ncbi:MAG TPA: hemerythrin domain-containing protein [Jiangellales bacterium]|nr:hemerythrin domain-containing protein [Jiangellales bacterium]